jgi:hypothetical protein
MNGKELKFHGYADFDDPHRVVQTGRHTTVEAFEAQMKRSARHGVSVYGWMWCEEKVQICGGVSPVRFETRIFEAIPRCQKPWQDAKRRALKEQPLLPPIHSEADCCLKAAHCVEEHQQTVRHFRYWCLKFPELAVRAWPWIKELIAEDVLTCNERS